MEPKAHSEPERGFQHGPRNQRHCTLSLQLSKARPPYERVFKSRKLQCSRTMSFQKGVLDTYTTYPDDTCA